MMPTAAAAEVVVAMLAFITNGQRIDRLVPSHIDHTEQTTQRAVRVPILIATWHIFVGSLFAVAGQVYRDVPNFRLVDIGPPATPERRTCRN